MQNSSGWYGLWMIPIMVLAIAVLVYGAVRLAVHHEQAARGTKKSR